MRKIRGRRSPGALRGALLVMALAAAACERQPTPVAELLTDPTRSAVTADMQTQVDQALATLTECGAGQGLHLIVALMSNSPASERIVFNDQIDPRGENPETRRRNAPLIAQDVIEAVEPSISKAMSAPVEGTAAFHSLVAAGADLRQFEGSPRTLVWVSDGIEWSESGGRRWNLARADLSATGIDTLLDSLRDDDLVADLRGVNVYAAGIGLAPGIDSATATRLQAFWRTYLTEAGATVRFIGPRLVALPCP